jgi:hypothetical protein
MLSVITATRLASGQAFFTGETGKGTSSVFVAANTAIVRDFTANFWTAYTRGVHDRVNGFCLLWKPDDLRTNAALRRRRIQHPDAPTCRPWSGSGVRQLFFHSLQPAR